MSSFMKMVMYRSLNERPDDDIYYNEDEKHFRGHKPPFMPSPPIPEKDIRSILTPEEIELIKGYDREDRVNALHRIMLDVQKGALTIRKANAIYLHLYANKPKMIQAERSIITQIARQLGLSKQEFIEITAPAPTPVPMPMPYPYPPQKNGEDLGIKNNTTVVTQPTQPKTAPVTPTVVPTVVAPAPQLPQQKGKIHPLVIVGGVALAAWLLIPSQKKTKTVKKTVKKEVTL